jgi:hypothetical protein
MDGQTKKEGNLLLSLYQVLLWSWNTVEASKNGQLIACIPP